jgi:hypothetical protein
MTRSEAYVAAVAADNAWDAKLPKTTNARYLPVGKGEEGSELRALYDARQAALATWWDMRDNDN